MIEIKPYEHIVQYYETDQMRSHTTVITYAGSRRRESTSSSRSDSATKSVSSRE